MDFPQIQKKGVHDDIQGQGEHITELLFYMFEGVSVKAI